MAEGFSRSGRLMSNVGKEYTIPILSMFQGDDETHPGLPAGHKGRMEES
jgi:hypothetical protein